MKISKETTVPALLGFEKTGIHALIALDDSGVCVGSAGALLRQEIADRYRQTRDSGGTTLPFLAWKHVFRTTAVLEAVPHE